MKIVKPMAEKQARMRHWLTTHHYHLYHFSFTIIQVENPLEAAERVITSFFEMKHFYLNLNLLFSDRQIIWTVFYIETY